MDSTTLDEMAYKSRFVLWPPLGKLLLALSLLFGSLFAKSPIVPIIVLIVGLTFIFLSSNFKLPKYIALAYLNTLLLLFIGAIVILFLTPGTVLWAHQIPFFTISFAVSITVQGANLAILVFIRALAGFAVLLFFSSSTPIPHLFIALRQIKIPEHVSELTILIYRYFFLLLEQFGNMVIAADCRLGFKNLKTTIRTSGMLAAGIFGRSMDFAERAQQALYCRNFQGKFPTLNKPKEINFLWIIGTICIFLGLIYFSYKSKNILVFQV